MRINLFILLSFFQLVGMAQTQLIWQRSIQGGANFSSPVFTPDLNRDGVGDLILCSGIEGSSVDSAIIALDGSDGSTLWVRWARNQLYSTPHFYDVTGDGIQDVFIGGRDAQFMLLNGSNGRLIWQFWDDTSRNPADSGWYNFYSPIFTDDITGDDVPELILTNGGDASAKSGDTSRPAGHLIILDGAKGTLLSQITAPDRRETYFSPIYFIRNQLDTLVVFGTGGETVAGHLYGIPLPDLKAQDTSGIVTLLSGKTKGFIASPIVIPHSSGSEQLIVPQLDLGIISVESESLQSTVLYEDRSSEFYVTPAPMGIRPSSSENQFASLAWFSAEGIFPFYTSYRALVDSETQPGLDLDTSFGIYQLMSPNAMDVNQDGLDDLVIGINYDVGSQTVQYRNQLFWVETSTNTWKPLTPQQTGLMLYAQPLFTELDANSKTDLIVISNNNESNWYNHSSYTVSRFEFTDNRSIEGTWPSYRGSNGDGRGFFQPKLAHAVQEASHSLLLFPNPAHKMIRIAGIEQEIHQLQVLTSEGQEVDLVRTKRGNTVELDVSTLPSGLYRVVILTTTGNRMSSSFMVSAR